MKKRIISVIIILTICATLCVPVMAASTSDEIYPSLNNYKQYTLNFSQNRAFGTQTNADKIDEAISYVKSLNLPEKGYAHIEEACLMELSGYKNDGVLLERYTVLVPKVRQTSYYGTYLGSDFYYEYTSVSDFRR